MRGQNNKYKELEMERGQSGVQECKEKTKEGKRLRENNTNTNILKNKHSQNINVVNKDKRERII